MRRITIPFALADLKLTSLLLDDYLQHVESPDTAPTLDPEIQFDVTQSPPATPPEPSERQRPRRDTEPRSTRAAHPAPALRPGSHLAPG